MFIFDKFLIDIRLRTTLLPAQLPYIHTEGTSFYDLVKKHGFQFVHEVQHWLMDEFHDDGLKANHTLR